MLSLCVCAAAAAASGHWQHESEVIYGSEILLHFRISESVFRSKGWRMHRVTYHLFYVRMES
jgi:hypothetical protein